MREGTSTGTVGAATTYVDCARTIDDDAPHGLVTPDYCICAAAVMAMGVPGHASKPDRVWYVGPWAIGDAGRAIGAFTLP